MFILIFSIIPTKKIYCMYRLFSSIFVKPIVADLKCLAVKGIITVSNNQYLQKHVNALQIKISVKNRRRRHLSRCVYPDNAEQKRPKPYHNRESKSNKQESLVITISLFSID